MKSKVFDKVYNKDFAVDKLGYNAKEVDAFLDEVNEEVLELEKQITRLKASNEKLETKVNILQDKVNDQNIKISKLKSKKENDKINTDNYNNVNIIERLSNLENKVEKLCDNLLDKKDN